MKKIFTLFLMAALALTGMARGITARDGMPAIQSDGMSHDGLEERRMSEWRDGNGLRRERSEEERVTLSVTTTAPGELAGLVGDALYSIDEITVSGPLNDEDIHTLWLGSFEGYLKVMDLGNASLEGNTLPPLAFYNPKEQLKPDEGYIYIIWLEKIILPAGLEEIGRSAFLNAYALREVVCPASLKRIGDSSFYRCDSLIPANFHFNDGLEEIGDDAFWGCYNFAGEVTLPSSLKSIGKMAFQYCLISKANFPSSLEYIGAYAFSFNKFEEIDLPDNCELDAEGHQFSTIFSLKRAHIPDGLTIVPENLFMHCINLTEVNIPSHAVEIAPSAFYNCNSLLDVEIPEGVELIGEEAFLLCTSLKEIALPSTLREIGTHAFSQCNNIKRIYSEALTPPACDQNTFFGISSWIPVAVPLGTGDAYRNAPGWNYFHFFVETDDFPTGVESVVSEGMGVQDQQMYDLSGKRIQNPVPGEIYIRNGKKFIN